MEWQDVIQKVQFVNSVFCSQHFEDEYRLICNNDRFSTSMYLDISAIFIKRVESNVNIFINILIDLGYLYFSWSLKE